ncbi:MAG: hypothetical protein NTY32_03930, partial [Bacteroidia bacterium]|nr:hypothetical protein [Bacteroidia bacterium]
MKKLNTNFSLFRGFMLLVACSLVSLSTIKAMDPVKINFFYVAGTTFANPDTFPTWNTVSHYQGWSSRSGLSNLKDIKGVPTKLRIKITTDFFGYNTSGASSRTMGMTDSVSKSNFYGNSTYKGGVTLYGLDPKAAYKISIFGSRNGTTSTADVVYTMNDAANSKLTLSCANNVTGLAIFNSIKPTYLAAMMVEEASTTPAAFSPFYINFGPTAVTGWNTLTSYATAGAPLNNLVDAAGNASNINLKITTSFSGIIGTTGMGSTTTDLNMPDDVSKSNIYKTAAGGAFSITGLDATKKYKFSIFGSRGGLTEARDVVYVLNDLAASTVTLDVANNATNLAVLNNIMPKADGSLICTLNFGTNNTTYTYINALKIDTASTITSNSLIGINRNGLKAFVLGETVRVWWNNEANCNSLVRIFNMQGKLLQN